MPGTTTIRETADGPIRAFRGSAASPSAPTAATGSAPSGRRELLTTQVYVRGDPGNPRDFLWRSLTAEDRNALTVPFERAADGERASFDIVVAA